MPARRVRWVFLRYNYRLGASRSRGGDSSRQSLGGYCYSVSEPDLISHNLLGTEPIVVNWLRIKTALS